MDATTLALFLGLAATVGGALLGVVYAAGKLAARVESLESWRGEMNAELKAIHDGIRRVEGMIRGEET